MRRELQRAGVLPHTFAYERALKLGFVCANACRQSSEDALLVVDDLDRVSALLKLTRADLVPKDRVALDRIKAALGQHGERVPSWFSVGFWCSTATWTLTSACLRLEQELGASIDTESVRALLSSDREVRSACSSFASALLDLGQSPAEVEQFMLEKIFPFAWDGGHQKWLFSLDMPVMQDLAFLARQDDKVLREFESARGYGALREFIDAIPIVGKAIGTLAFGPKQ